MTATAWRGILASARLRAALTGAAIASLLASSLGTAWVFSTPTDVLRDVPSATYEQAGKFSYQALTKPGSVFAQLAAARSLTDLGVLRSDPQLFAKLIDDLEVTYSYGLHSDQLTAASNSVVALRLVVSAPGAWQKELQLLPPTTYSGPFAAKARVNMGEVQALIATIEQDIGQLSPAHALRLVADVRTAARGGNDDVVDETFHQELAGTLDHGLLSWEGPVEQSTPGTGASWPYTQTGTFGYAARLKPNLLFSDTPVGASAQVLPDGWPLYTNIVDHLHMVFAYQLSDDQPTDGLAHRVQVSMRIEKPSKWSKEFVVAPETTQTGGSFSVPFDLDLTSITDLVRKLEKEGPPSDDGLNVALTASVATEGVLGDRPIRETFTQVVQGTLRNGTFTIVPDGLARTTSGRSMRREMVSNTVDALPLGPLGSLPIGSWSVTNLRVAAILSLTGLVVLAVGLFLALRQTHPDPAAVGLSAGQAKVRRKYGDLIVAARAVPPAALTDVKVAVSSLEDLVKVAVDASKPVLQLGTSERAAYLVLDGSTRYVYDPLQQLGGARAAARSLSQRLLEAEQAGS